MKEWTVIRIRGQRTTPAIDATEFLSCISVLREALGGTRWHFQWMPAGRRAEVDGLRVELPYQTQACQQLVARLESRVPPPDSVVSEPLHP
ncbi:MAG: hypothetical protein ACWGON_09645, partial [Gemmatimonadota bacterium]